MRGSQSYISFVSYDLLLLLILLLALYILLERYCGWILRLRSLSKKPVAAPCSPWVEVAVPSSVKITRLVEIRLRHVPVGWYLDPLVWRGIGLREHGR